MAIQPEELVAGILKSGLADPRDIRGCTEEEIEDLERASGVDLPESYKRFLRAIGHGSGRFLDDCNTSMGDVSDLTSRVRSEMDDTITLPDNAFVFAERMGEAFLFFWPTARMTTLQFMVGPNLAIL